MTAGALVAGCDSGDINGQSAEESEFGEVGMRIEIPGGLIVNEVSFSITGNDIIPIEGTIPVEEVGSTVSALIGGIPSGVGYTLTLTAVTENGEADCFAETMFDVIAGQTTSITITLDCTLEVDDGTVIIDGDFNTCPDIISLVALPLEVEVGDDIILTSSASDNDGDELEYSWTEDPAGAGTFSTPGEQNTNFSCALAGPATLVLEVSDGRCSDVAEVDVVCAAAGVCGNGTPETGEQCDDGNTDPGDGCSATCRNEVCGNSVIDPGEQCDAGPSGSATCRAPGHPDGECTIILPAGCGNNQIDTGEECDDGANVAGDGCDESCFIEECGNGRVQFGEDCDDGNLTNGDGCSDVCEVELAPCLACTFGVQECSDRWDVCDDSLCTDAYDCSVNTGCAGLASIDCYCGGLTPFSCLTNPNPPGECVNEVRAAAGTTDPQLIAERFINPDFALGRAFRIVECQRVNCSTECELTP